MRVAFLAFHCRYHYQALGAAFLEAALAQRRPQDECRLFQYPLTTPMEHVLADLLDFSPDVLCISAYLWSLTKLHDAALRLKTIQPACTCILGGPEAWLAQDDPDHPLLRPFDSGLCGEGEGTLPDLLDSLEGNEILPKVIQAQPIEDLDALPSPFERDFLRRDVPFLHLESSRGCSNHCTFCISGKEPTRRYSLERFGHDLQTVLQRFPKLTRLNLLDRSLNEETQRFIAILELFLSLDNQRTLHFEFHPGFTDDEQLRFLEQAPQGRFHLEMGIQSLDASVTALAGRRQDAAQAQDVARRLQQSGTLDLHLDLLAGLPRQDLSQLRQDIDALGRIAPEAIQLERLKLLPGTPMRRHAKRLGLHYANTPLWEILQTQDMTAKDLCETDRLSRLLDRYWNDAHLQGTLEALVRDGLPLTQVLDTLDRLDPARDPQSVEARFETLHHALNELESPQNVWDQFWFDRCLLGLPRVLTPSSKDPDNRPRLLRILKRLHVKGRGHLERFSTWPKPLGDLASGLNEEVSDSTGFDLLFLYLPGEVQVGLLSGNDSAPILDPLGHFEKGRLVPERSEEEEEIF